MLIVYLKIIWDLLHTLTPYFQKEQTVVSSFPITIKFVFIYLVAQAQFSNKNVKTAEVMVGCFVPDYKRKYFSVVQVRMLCGSFYMDTFLKNNSSPLFLVC